MTFFSWTYSKVLLDIKNHKFVDNNLRKGVKRKQVTPNFLKYSYFLTPDTDVCVYQRVRNVHLSENLGCFVFL